MANSHITTQYLRQILHYDPETGIFRWAKPRPKIKVGAIAGGKAAKGHIAIKIDGKSYKAHRLAWLYMTGDWPKDQIDHINRLPHDNRFINLRDCNTSDNCHNQGIRKNNTTGSPGIQPSGNKWVALISRNMVQTNLGSFDTKEEAAAAYAKAKSQYSANR